MTQVSRASTSSLPGPATAPGAHMPAQDIPLQSLSPLNTTSSVMVDEKAKRDQAWKFEGYKAFSKWMASEDDFFVFRRFESLNAGTILWMQDHISQLESRLHQIHKDIEESKPEQSLKNCSFRWDAKYMQERNMIMSELSRQLLHYNQYIDSFSKVRARPRAKPRQIRNVCNWLARDAIDPDEAAFIDHKSDLISINSRNRPPLGQWLEACSKLHFFKLFKAKQLDDLHVQSASTTYSDNTKFEGFTNISIILIGLVMLLAPMWWLEYVSTSETRLKIITGFIVAFIAMMSTATINRPFEVVAATAAYAAVLMVFMQM
ncbi:hypothetical protein P153DRAFT_309790, partial [Dothidotthia symphoricarpi CBS 119687]